MAKVHVCNVNVLNNPCTFADMFQFAITFECIEELKEDLEWKIIYVGSAESEAYDQVLDTVFVGPVPEGRHMFTFEADPPDTSKIPVADAVGVTVVLLTCSYRSKEFVRVGYYVNNEYSDPELRENPPSTPSFDKLMRNILDTQPRVTRFKIDWDDKSNSASGNSTAAISAEPGTSESMLSSDKDIEMDKNRDCFQHDGPFDNSMENNGLDRPSNFVQFNNEPMDFQRPSIDRLSADSTNSLLDGADVSLIGSAISCTGDNSSINSAMEVTF